VVAELLHANTRLDGLTAIKNKKYLDYTQQFISQGNQPHSSAKYKAIIRLLTKTRKKIFSLITTIYFSRQSATFFG
jgi:hypothetical protein